MVYRSEGRGLRRAGSPAVPKLTTHLSPGGIRKRARMILITFLIVGTKYVAIITLTSGSGVHSGSQFEDTVHHGEEV